MRTLHVVSVFSQLFPPNAAGASSHIKQHACKPLTSAAVTKLVAYEGKNRGTTLDRAPKRNCGLFQLINTTAVTVVIFKNSARLQLYP